MTKKVQVTAGEHRVERDYPGWGNHIRYTCVQRGCPHKRTLLCSEHLSDDEYDRRVKEFFELHPNTTVNRNRYSG